MSALVLPRLFVRPLTLWNFVLGASMSVGFVMAARGIRGEVPVLKAAQQSVDFLPGVIAFVAATTFASLVAYSVFELLSCPFSSNLPSAVRRARNEVLALAAVATLAAGAIGIAFRLGARDALLVMLFAALGCGLGVFASDPRSRSRRIGGFGMLAVFLVFTVQIPEITAAVRAHPIALAAVGFALAGALAWLPFRPARQRARASTRTADLDRAYREIDMRSGTWGATDTAPRDGAAPTSGPRRTDTDWALATLHEAQGFIRGGWIGAAFGRALIGVLFVLAGQFIVAWNVHPDADRLEQLALFVDSSGGTLTLWFVIVAVTAPFFPVQSVLRPIARERRARVAWLVTLIEDVAFVGFLGLLLGVIALALGLARPETQSTPSWPTWAFSVLVASALSPLARWAKLRFYETLPGNPGPLRQGLVSGIAGCVLIAVTVPALFAWLHASPTSQRLQVGAWIVAWVVGRWIWLELIRQHVRERDLAA